MGVRLVRQDLLLLGWHAALVPCRNISDNAVTRPFVCALYAAKSSAALHCKD